MKKIILLLFLYATGVFSQTEIVDKVTVGYSSGDISNQPVSVSSEYSHSQTIYYPDQLGFVGEINELRFQTLFYTDALTNTNEWVVKIGLTTKNAFATSDSFIDSSTFTDVFSGTVVKSGYDVIVTFSQPFYYDGTQNLVLDIEDVQPGKGSPSVGFKGVEDFANPPKRSRMTFTSNGTTQTLVENSYAVTEFYGSLTICARMRSPEINNITVNSAEIHLFPNPNIPVYKYSYHKASEPIPSDYALTSSLDLLLTDLQPATDYYFNAKADCDIAGSKYSSYPFTTKIIPLTLGSSIDFDEEFNPGTYYLSSGRFAKSEVSTLAGTDGSKGLLFRSAEHGGQGWNAYDIFKSNPNLVSASKFLLEVPEDSNYPIFKFDLQQDAESYFRIKINNLVYDFQFSGPSNPEGTFETITIDLGMLKGETVVLEMQHVSSYSGQITNGYIRKAYVDNIFFKEADCILTEEFSVTPSSTTSLTLNSSSTESENWEVVAVKHGENPREGTILNFSDFPFTLQNLEVASSYDVYVRKDCGNGFSLWKKLIESTFPEIIQVPHQESFPDFNGMFAPIYNEASRIEFTSFPSTIALIQKKSHSKWVGDLDTTEDQAWNENKDFSTALKLRVDALDLNTLTLELKFRLRYYYNPQTSWFRFLINGEQFGDSYNATGVNPNVQIVTLDLSAFTGQIVEVELEHVGRNVDYYPNGNMDGIQIFYANFTGEMGCPRPTDLAVDNISESMADVSWVAGEDETNWVVKYGLQNFDPSTSGDTIEVTGNPLTSLSNLDSATTYDVYIKALCTTDDQSSWSGPLTFTTDQLQCLAPDNILIENITHNSVEVSWSAGGAENQWEVLYGEAGFDPQNAGTTILVNQTGITIQNLIYNTDYELYVRSICTAEIFSGWSDQVSFTTQQLPCLFPENMVVENITTDSAEVSWSAGGAENQWEVLYGEAGFDPQNAGTSIFVNEPELVLENLESNTGYDVYIRSICAEDNKSEWIGPESFTTEVLGFEDYKVPGIQVFPNPFKDFINIQSDKNLEYYALYDLQGRKIKAGTINAKSELNLSSLASGSYILSLRTHNGEISNFQLIKN